MSHKVRWTPQKIAQRIQLIAPLVYARREPLPPFRFAPLSGPDVAPPLGPDVDDSTWETIEPNTYWAGWRVDFVLRGSFKVPAEWAGDARPIALYLPLGEAGDFSHPEALTYVDGAPYAAADRHHQEIRLRDGWRDGAAHTLVLHGWTGLGGWIPQPEGSKLLMRTCQVVMIDPPTRDLVATARVAHEVASQLSDEDPVKGRLYNALDGAFRVLDTRDPIGGDAFYASVPAALETLKSGIAAAGAPLDVDIVAAGHAHIDVAWLWTLDQTVRKSGRTFSTVLRLMEEFPTYTFSQSQAQLYSYTEKHYPELFAQITERVAEGRWEVMGGTWVEPDCNCIGAESLARQFLLGRGYFRKHFGDVDTPVLWLPDTFGYSWALPQLIKLAGMKYFITHKMSWNQYNAMPHQILWWQGLDGTRILTHFLTTPAGDEYLPHATTYNAVVSGSEVFGTWRNFHQKETYNELLTAYGYGDGGGGPTREMIQNVERLNAFPGAPRVKSGSVRAYMDRIETEISDRLPVWNGEFYFEYHRGTYTSQARNKRNNRKSEFLLHDAEFLAALATQQTGAAYPTEVLAEAWELTCLNQFHDILPGSSIGPVYVDSDRDYAHIRRLGDKALDGALAALGAALPAGSRVLAANPTSFGGRRIGHLAGDLGVDGVADTTGRALATQRVADGTLVEVLDLAPYSVVGLSAGKPAAPAAPVSARHVGAAIVLENALLRVDLAPNGDLVRVLDKRVGRDVLARGAVGNALLAFEDRPMNFDAWDIDIYYEDRSEKVEGVAAIAITETGPLRATVTVERAYRSSRIIQKIQLCADSARIDFDTWIDWHEQHTLLKTAFPVDVMSPTATFDVQWGNVQRPTHRNTSWDWARFETCAHKWADLSEGNYGVALLNDCKYGYDIHDNVLRLTLLKSATSPDPTADQGQHRMTYSLLPHAGDWRADVPAAAYDLNDPLILRHVDDAAGGLKPAALVALDAPWAVIESVKRAEDGRGLIVRLFENQRNRGRVVLRAGFPVAQAQVCNLLEEDQGSLTVANDGVEFDLSPYQILSIRLIAV